MSASFQRTIGFSTAVSLVVGSIIGSGIFMRPAEMAGLLGSPLLMMLVWVIAGVLSLCSAMVLAELGAMLPQTGGQYAFMKHMYNDFWAYLYGWANFAVINTAGTAGIAFISAEYAGYFLTLPRFSAAMENSVILHLPLIGDILPLQHFGAKVLTIVLLAVLSFFSYFSTRLGGRLQLVFTVAKVMALVILIVGLVSSGKGSFQHFFTGDAAIRPAGIALVAALVAACNGALQAYDGFGNMVYVAGEIKNPARNIPRSLLAGLFICIIIYLFVTGAMLYMLPIDAMAQSALVASDATRKAYGTIGGGVVALLIIISVIGTTNASVMTAPRMTFAMARQHHFLPWAGKVHPVFLTPARAILLHFAVMAVMVLSGSFYILADMYIFITWAFNLMMVAGLFRLRKKWPDVERPYKIWGYPWLPLLLLLSNLLYLVITLINDISRYAAGETQLIHSVFGLFLTALGIPLYWWFKKKHRSRPAATKEELIA
jgi:APA family basic amino acid/polyamine antiporter